MIEILNRFFRFCGKKNGRKFFITILIGLLNSFFVALRIAAVAVMLRGIIGSLDAAGAVQFNANTIWLAFAIMIVSLAGATVTKRISSMMQTEAGYDTCATKRIEIAEHLRYLPMGYFNENSLGYITSVTTNTMEQLGDVATRVQLRSVSKEKTVVDSAAVSEILEYIQGIAEVKAYNLTGRQSAKLNRSIENSARVNTNMELKCIPLSNVQSLVAKLTGVAILLAAIYFYLGGSMALADTATMLVCAFMLFSALEVGGNYSALLRVVDLSVEKAQKILDLPTMDIDGKALENEAPAKDRSLIANNIRFGEPSAPMDKVIAAAKKACCHDFIEKLPDGYNTVIGEGGASLSGGEKQRISIARAIMKDAPIIVLDEATANIDPENERELMSAIAELTQEKTVIMIAHRLKTVRNADQIIVLDKGKIVQQGKHDDLMRQDGIYRCFVGERREAVGWKI